MRTAFLLLVFTATALQGWAQNAENRQISLEMKNEPLGSALKQFSNVSGYKVNFPSEDVAPYRVTVSIYQMAPFAALQKILEGKPFEYDVKQNFITVRKVKATSTTAIAPKGLLSTLIFAPGKGLPPSSTTCPPTFLNLPEAVVEVAFTLRTVMKFCFTSYSKGFPSRIL